MQNLSDTQEERRLQEAREQQIPWGKWGPEGGLLVRNSDTEPQDAFVSVKYRNHWFWVDARDLASKRALSFSMLLLACADTGSDKSLPLVTIPAR